MLLWDIDFVSPWPVDASDYDAQLKRATDAFMGLGAVFVGEYGSRGVIGVSDLDLYAVFPDATARKTLAMQVALVLHELDPRIVQHAPFVMPLWACSAWASFHPAPINVTPRGLNKAALDGERNDSDLRRAFFAVEGAVDIMRRLQLHYEHGAIQAFTLLASVNSLRQSIDVLNEISTSCPSHLTRYAGQIRQVREELATERLWSISSKLLLAELGNTAPHAALLTLEALGKAGAALGWWDSKKMSRWARLGNYRFFLSPFANAAIDAVYGDTQTDQIVGLRTVIRTNRSSYAEWLGRNGFGAPGMGIRTLKRSRRSRVGGLLRRKLPAHFGRPWLFDRSLLATGELPLIPTSVESVQRTDRDVHSDDQI